MLKKCIVHFLLWSTGALFFSLLFFAVFLFLVLLGAAQMQGQSLSELSLQSESVALIFFFSRLWGSVYLIHLFAVIFSWTLITLLLPVINQSWKGAAPSIVILSAALFPAVPAIFFNEVTVWNPSQIQYAGTQILMTCGVSGALLLARAVLPPLRRN